MQEKLKIENIGYNANYNKSLRATREGNEYGKLIPSPDWQEQIVRRNASVGETVAEMKKLILKSAEQTKELSKNLIGDTIYNTCKNIWEFLFYHIRYREDDAGQEQLRTPALSWQLRKQRGIDCDDFSIFAGTILYNLKIPFYLRIARYTGKDYFQHVYVTVPQEESNYIIIDAVLSEFDTEKVPEETKDYLIMDNSNLNGIDISVLSGIGEDELSEISGILSGDDFHELTQMEGLGRIPSREQELSAIRNHLIRTRGVVKRFPHTVKYSEDAQAFLGMVDYALQYWDSDKREEALGILEIEEERQNEINGVHYKPEGYEETGLYYGIEGLNGVSVLGKVKAKKAFFKKVKQAVKKAGTGIKKIAKKIIRFNPATITARGGVLAAMKTNFLKIAERLKWGYLTEEEAKRLGFDLGEWKNARESLRKTEHLFVNVLQGKAENLKKAILTGRAGGLSGLGDLGELGVEPASMTAGAVITTAMPFITKIIGFLKKINFKKLIANVSPVLLKRRKKRADTESENTEAEQIQQEQEIKERPEAAKEREENSDIDKERKSALPEAEGSSESPEKSLPPAMDNTTEKTGSSENKPGEENENTLPAKQVEENAEVKSISKESGAETENFFERAKLWMKEHPGASILLAGSAILGIGYGVSKMMKPKTLSGAGKKGKKKKGAAKQHPPKSIAGARRRRGGNRGKGGAPKVRL